MILGQQEDRRMNAAAIASIGIDLGNGVVVRRRFSRSQLLAYTANPPWSLIGMEACSGAHFLAAKLRDQPLIGWRV
jgi:hypothetical protein